MKITWSSRYRNYGGTENAARIYPRLLSELGHEVYIRNVIPNTPAPNLGLPVTEEPKGVSVLHEIPTIEPNRHHDVYFFVGEYDILPPEDWPYYAKAKMLMSQSDYCEKLVRKVPGCGNTPFAKVAAPVPEIFFENKETFDFGADFVFGSVFAWWDRKVPELMWRAFLEEFPRDEYPNVLFVNRIVPTFRTVWRAFRYYTRNDPRIVPITDKEVNIPKFYSSIDVYVSPTAGEGFGLTVAEAMASGKPVIVSNHSAPTEFVNERVGWPVDVEDWSYCAHYERPFRDPKYLRPYLRWRLPKAESIRKAMREAYENRKESVMKGKRAKTLIRKISSLESVRIQLKDAVKKMEEVLG